MDGWLVDLATVSGRRRHPFAFKAVTQIRRLLLLILDGWSGRAQIWEGTAAGGGQTLRVAYLGDDRCFKYLESKYLQHILFNDGVCATVERAKFPMVRARYFARLLSKEVDLVILQSNHLVHWHPANSGAGEWWVVSPCLRTVMDFAEGQSWAEILEGMHAQRKNIKVMGRSGGVFRVSHSDQDFDFFYDRMHVPLVKERHASYGVVDTREGARSLFHQGNLMLICQPESTNGGSPNGETILAGSLNHIHGRTFFGIGLGVLDGDTRLYNQGVITQLYFESIRWAFENKMERLDFGSVRPFVNDGLFDYKRRWGFQPVLDPWYDRQWLFWVPRGSPVAAEWLRAHPFLLPTACSR